MLSFHCEEWRHVLRLCIVNDGPEATFSILGHRSNKLSKSFWVCMDGLKLPMKNFSCVVSNAFSVSLSVDSISVLLHWSTVSFPGNQIDLSLWADTSEFQDLLLDWVCGNCPVGVSGRCRIRSLLPHTSCSLLHYVVFNRLYIQSNFVHVL